jgi:hypothetical protein
MGGPKSTKGSQNRSCASTLTSGPDEGDWLHKLGCGVMPTVGDGKLKTDGAPVECDGEAWRIGGVRSVPSMDGVNDATGMGGWLPCSVRTAQAATKIATPPNASIARTRGLTPEDLIAGGSSGSGPCTAHSFTDEEQERLVATTLLVRCGDPVRAHKRRAHCPEPGPVARAGSAAAPTPSVCEGIRQCASRSKSSCGARRAAQSLSPGAASSGRPCHGAALASHQFPDVPIREHRRLPQ